MKTLVILLVFTALVVIPCLGQPRTANAQVFGYMNSWDFSRFQECSTITYPQGSCSRRHRRSVYTYDPMSRRCRRVYGCYRLFRTNIFEERYQCERRCEFGSMGSERGAPAPGAPPS